MEGTTATQTTATETSLKVALQSNRELQLEIIRQIQRLAKQKSDNRKLASRVSGHLSSTWEEIDKIRTPVAESYNVYSEIQNIERAGDQEEKEEATTTRKDTSLGTEKHPVQHINKTPKPGRLPKPFITKWQYDPHRKWTRRFFVDPDGKIPAHNSDVAKRRALEKGKAFHHNYSRWSKNEIELLCSIVSEQLENSIDQGTNSTISVAAGTIEKGVEFMEQVNFDQVAHILKERTKEKGTAPTRSAAECRTIYLNTLNTSAFSKEESLQLLKLVHSRKGPLCWKELASALRTNRTPWQCMVTFNTKLLPRGQPTSWTPAEDELILKYAAAMGPQWHLDGPAAAHMSSTLLPDKTARQI